MMTIPEFRAALRRSSNRFLTIALGAAVAVSGLGLAAAYYIDPVVALGVFLVGFPAGVGAAALGAGRVRCGGCRAVLCGPIIYPSEVIADRHCPRCRVRVLDDPTPGEPVCTPRPLAEVEPAVRQVAARGEWVGHTSMLVTAAGVAGVLTLGDWPLWPGWLTPVLCVAVFAATLTVTMIVRTRDAHRNPAAFCPHCRQPLLFVGRELRRTGRCGYCGRPAVSDPPAGVAAGGPTG